MSFKYSKNWTKAKIIEEATKKFYSMIDETKNLQESLKTLRSLLEDRGKEIEFLQNALIDSQRQVNDVKIERSSYLSLLIKLYGR